MSWSAVRWPQGDRKSTQGNENTHGIVQEVPKLLPVPSLGFCLSSALYRLRTETVRHFRDTLEWTSGDRHSIRAGEDSVLQILLLQTHTDAGPAQAWRSI